MLGLLPLLGISRQIPYITLLVQSTTDYMLAISMPGKRQARAIVRIDLQKRRLLVARVPMLYCSRHRCTCEFESSCWVPLHIPYWVCIAFEYSSADKCQVAPPCWSFYIEEPDGAVLTCGEKQVRSEWIYRQLMDLALVLFYTADFEAAAYAIEIVYCDPPICRCRHYRAINLAMAPAHGSNLQLVTQAVTRDGNRCAQVRLLLDFRTLDLEGLEDLIPRYYGIVASWGDVDTGKRRPGRMGGILGEGGPLQISGRTRIIRDGWVGDAVIRGLAKEPLDDLPLDHCCATCLTSHGGISGAITAQ